MSEKQLQEETSMDTCPGSPVSPPAPSKKKRKGGKLESKQKKKQNTTTPLVVKSKTQLLKAIEEKKGFELYSSFKRIDLTDAFIEPLGAELLGGALKGAEIAELNLSGNYLPSHCMAPVLSSLQYLTAIESLDLSRNKLEDTDAQVIWNFISANNTLTKLDLSRNSISLGGAWVAAPLQQNTTLATLMLSGNPLEKGVNFLAKGLCDNTRLESMDLQDVKLGRAFDIIHLLKVNTSLTRLDLSGNPIGAKSGTLCEALRGNKTLVELNLQKTGLSLGGLSKFIHILQENTTLRYVHVAKNGLPVVLKKAFRRLLATRRDLRVINNLADDSEVSYNVITEEEDVEQQESEEEQDCTAELCDWPEYKQLKMPALEHAVDFLAAHPELCVDVVVPSATDTNAMRHFYDAAMVKLRAEHEALEIEVDRNDNELSAIAEPLQEKEQSLNELVQQQLLLEIQIKTLRQERDEYQLEYLTRKIPAILTEDILNAVEANVELLAQRQRDAVVQFEANAAKMKRPLIKWDEGDVAMLLKELNLGQYADKFTSSAIAGSVLVNLDTTDLVQDLQMDWKHAKKLLHAVFLLNHQRNIYEPLRGVFEWSTDDTCQWLVSVGFEKYAPVFRRLKVTGQELLLIDKYDLSNVLKIESLVDKLALEREIKSLLAKQGTPGIASEHSVKHEGPNSFVQKPKTEPPETSVQQKGGPLPYALAKWIEE